MPLSTTRFVFWYVGALNWSALFRESGSYGYARPRTDHCDLCFVRSQRRDCAETAQRMRRGCAETAQRMRRDEIRDRRPAQRFQPCQANEAKTRPTHVVNAPPAANILQQRRTIETKATEKTTGTCSYHSTCFDEFNAKDSKKSWWWKKNRKLEIFILKQVLWWVGGGRWINPLQTLSQAQGPLLMFHKLIQS